MCWYSSYIQDCCTVVVVHVLHLSRKSLVGRQMGYNPTQTRNLFLAKALNLFLLKQRDIENFKGGRVKQFLNQWKTLTSDNEILSIIQGLQLEFISNLINNTIYLNIYLSLVKWLLSQETINLLSFS